MRLRNTFTFVLPAAVLVTASACGGGTPVVVNNPETPEAPAQSGTIEAPPPGQETTIETEGPDGEEKEVHIETEAD